jgi:hypothetical protein
VVNPHHVCEDGDSFLPLQIKVLEGLLEKDMKSSQRQELLLALQEESDVRHAPGGLEALRHLILRLDISEWWKNT